MLAENNVRLVYGGGSVGLMGAVAKGTLDNGGKAIGIVPEPLYRHGSKQLCETVIVPDMHARKKRMEEECDAFVCLPGGFGSFEEVLEIITWSQLNVHSKPIVLLNTKGFYKLFIDFINFSAQGMYAVCCVRIAFILIEILLQRNSFMLQMSTSSQYALKQRTLWIHWNLIELQKLVTISIGPRANESH